MRRGESGNEERVRKWRTFWGALCSANQDVPGSSSSFISESASESWVSLEGVVSSGLGVEMWARVRA